MPELHSPLMSIRPHSSWLLLIILAATLSLSGCLGTSVDTSQCSKFTDSQKDDCIYFLAVWSLSPETCYQVKSEAIRESCLSDSNDPDKSKSLQDRWYASGASTGSTKTTTPTPVINSANNTTISKPVAPPPVSEAAADSKIAKCISTNPKMTSDSCARQLAIDGRDLNYCVKISAPDMRQSCIVAVATNLKDIAACEIFKSSADKQFCVYYSRGN